MPDEIDQIQEQQQVILDAAIARARTQAEPRRASNCVDCGEPIPEKRIAERCVECQGEREASARRPR